MAKQKQLAPKKVLTSRKAVQVKAIGRKAVIMDQGEELDVPKRKRRFRAGTKALREIKKLQSSAEPRLIPAARFKKLVHEISNDITGNARALRWEKNAIRALQEAAEHALHEVFDASVEMMAHGKRVSVNADDFRLAQKYTLGMAPTAEE